MLINAPRAINVTIRRANVNHFRMHLQQKICISSKKKYWFECGRKTKLCWNNVGRHSHRATWRRRREERRTHVWLKRLLTKINKLKRKRRKWKISPNLSAFVRRWVGVFASQWVRWFQFWSQRKGFSTSGKCRIRRIRPINRKYAFLMPLRRNSGQPTAALASAHSTKRTSNAKFTRNRSVASPNHPWWSLTVCARCVPVAFISIR